MHMCTCVCMNINVHSCSSDRTLCISLYNFVYLCISLHNFTGNKWITRSSRPQRNSGMTNNDVIYAHKKITVI